MATKQGSRCPDRIRVGRRRLALAGVVAAALAVAAIGATPVYATGRMMASGHSSPQPPNPKDRLMDRLTSHNGTSNGAPRVSTPSITCNSTWNAVSSPNSGAGANLFASISADPANAADVWAVGLFLNGSGISQTLAEHWNGSAWSIVSTPNTGAGDNVLESVVTIDSNDAWAVGYSRPDNSSARQSLTEHWDGTAWSVVANPQVASASNSLFAVAAITSTDMWAVGVSVLSSTQWISLVMHYDGTSWTLFSATPSKGTIGTVYQLFGVRFVTSTNVWAVGDVQSSSSSVPAAFIEHWDGATWSEATAAPDNVNGDFLNDVAGTASDLWAVGGQFATSTTDNVLIEHSTDGGTTWTAVAGVTPDLSANLLSLAYISSTNIYAAGATAYMNPSTNSELDHTLVEQWNGSAWAQVTSANPGSSQDLFVISALSASDVWADGFSGSSTLAENFCTPPTVTNVAPNAGPAVGGTTVVITGTGFTGAAAVDFGSTAATSFTVNSATQITATSPAHPGGAVDVTVTVQGTSATSSADVFTYVAPIPVVTGVSPGSGPTTGGTAVTITGTGLLFATSVKFGTVAAASITSNSDTQIVAVSPAEAQSTVDVTVTTAGGTSATSPADQYMFVAPPPVVTGISPTSGDPAGGTSVTITGTGLSFATAVSFGSTPAASITSNTDTSITAVSPAHAAGIVHVTVTTAGGTSSATAADQYLFSNVYTVEAFGGVHPDGASPAIINEPTFSAPLARAAHMSPGLATQGLVLDAYGGLHPYGAEPSPAQFPYYPGNDIARDFVFLPSGTGGYELDGYGGIHAFSVGGNPLPAAPVQFPYFPGNDVARKITILADGKDGYVLDLYGGIHPWAASGGTLPVAPAQFGYWAGQNIARDIWVDPAATTAGASGYVVDRSGGFHPFWGGTAGAPEAIVNYPYWTGADLSRSFFAVAGSTPSAIVGYEIDAYGGIHPFAGAGQTLPPNLFPFAYWNGQDLARVIFGG
jgi:IPT/TIG domain-containing protein